MKSSYLNDKLRTAISNCEIIESDKKHSTKLRISSIDSHDPTCISLHLSDLSKSSEPKIIYPWFYEPTIHYSDCTIQIMSYYDNHHLDIYVYSPDSKKREEAIEKFKELFK
ncbi:MAG: hypothetical protein AABW67_01025 [Nanoarchaeota archaeon]